MTRYGTAIALLFAVLGACSPRVDYDGTGYQCLDGVSCPDGYVCVEQRCVTDPPGPDDPDAAGGGEDPDAAVGGEDEFVSIPETTFTMGCDDVGDADGCPSDASPAHEVTVSAFSIARTEVTQAAYAICVDAGECEQPSNFDPDEDPDEPVTYVLWQDAVDYCSFTDARLPTEAEWELAARGDDSATYPWGEEVPSCARAHYDACSPSSLIDAGEPAGDVSAFGVRGMAGNAAEWVQDWYDPDYYDGSPDVDPPGPASGTLRVLRGGSFDEGSSSLRAWNRTDEPPFEEDIEFGFRCARDL